MAWPTPQEYNEAIQSPQVCFSDPELKRGTPALTPLGLPRPISGAFASVYRIECHGRSWAVRCFLREYADQQQRYSAISDRLRAANLPCMVGFEFLEKGILVGGKWYPILKMEWIDGIPLNDYVGQNVSHGEILRSLSRRWIDLMSSLRRAGVAHGDLQHGNVLVRSGELKLIDYDAMFVPVLSGLQSHEEGHRNYQHPARSGKDFHADLDNFSAWVIFTSISALAIDPRFWKLPNVGDECLLFRREDFEIPRNSKMLQTLEKHGSLQLKTLVSHFHSLLTLPLSQIPSLDGTILDAKNEPRSSKAGARGYETQGLPGWMSDHIDRSARQPQLEPYDQVRGVTPIGGAAWLYDHLIDDGTATKIHLPTVSIRYRIAVWSMLGILLLLLAGYSMAWISGVLPIAVSFIFLMICTAILMEGYRATNTSGERIAIQERIRIGRTKIGGIEGLVELSKVERATVGETLATLKRAYDDLPNRMITESDQLDRRLATTLGSIDARRRNALNSHESANRALDSDVEQLDRNLTSTLKGIEERRTRADLDKDAAIWELENRIQSAIANLFQRKSTIAAEEKAEIDRLLQQSRSLHVRIALSQAKLSASDVSGVGESLASRLRAAGISCASDVNYDRVRNVPGIGEAKANALVAWRRIIEQRAISTSPYSLSQVEIARIREKYSSSSQTIDRQIILSKDEERVERQKIIQRHVLSRASLDSEEKSSRRDHEKHRNDLESNSKGVRLKLASDLTASLRKLDVEEEAAKREHNIQRDAVKSKYDRERDRLTTEYKAGRAKAVEVRKRLDEQFDQWNRSLFQVRIEVRQDELELDKHKTIRPRQYLRLVLIPRKLT